LVFGVPAVQAKAAANVSANVVSAHGAPKVGPNGAVTRALQQRFPQTRIGKVDCKLVAGLCEVRAGAISSMLMRSALPGDRPGL
jgi:hypothetical protein